MAKGGSPRVLALKGSGSWGSRRYAAPVPAQTACACAQRGHQKKKDDGEGTFRMQNIRDITTLTFGTLAFVFMVFGLTCFPSFLSGPVPHHHVAYASHGTHSRS